MKEEGRHQTKITTDKLLRKSEMYDFDKENTPVVLMATEPGDTIRFVRKGRKPNVMQQGIIPNFVEQSKYPIEELEQLK